MLHSGTIYTRQVKVKAIVVQSIFVQSTFFAFFQGDLLTRHAGKNDVANILTTDSIHRSMAFSACPVLVGNKWVANKWIHERGQEFRRPCAVDPKA
jgi:hypothetical protein